MLDEALSRCVWDPDTFCREEFGKRTVLLRGDGNKFHDLLTMKVIDDLLVSRGLRYPAFTLYRDGEALPPKGYVRTVGYGNQQVADVADPFRIASELASGATLAINGLHVFWEPISKFCESLESSLGHPIQANAYLTPPMQSGLGVHHDTHDVFAIQIHGRKKWQLAQSTANEAPFHRDWKRQSSGSQELILTPGDCLYVPRGWRHEVSNEFDEPSLHVTIGIQSYTEAELLHILFAKVAEEYNLWRSLEPHVVSDTAELKARLKQLCDLLNTCILSETIQGAVAETFYRQIKRGPIHAHTNAITRIFDEIDDATVVQARYASDWDIQEVGEEFILVVRNIKLSMPRRVGGAIRLLKQSRPVPVGDLQRLLDADSVKVLVARLLREGLLTSDADGDN